MRAVRWWSGLLGAVLATGAACAAPVPPVLEPWRGWVLHGHEDELCPALPGGEATACAWPGELRIEADAGGARFSQRWNTYSAQSLPLPGDAGEFRPIDVTLDGAPAPVAMVDGVPSLRVEAGTHEIAGRLAWDARPPTLPVPAEIAWIALRVDGADIAVPQRDELGALVLGATGAAEGDALELDVFRLLADGTPPWLATRIELSVSGKPREQVLGRFLPPGFVPVALDGDVPMRWEPDGRLRLQLRPGQWTALVIARVPAGTVDFALPSVPAPWPAQEIWQFRSAPEFRVAQLDGVPGVDPAQARVPEWELVGEDTRTRWGWMFDTTALPTYVLDADARATLAASLRGLPAQRPPRLSLAREMWLAFDGDEYLARDRLSGQLGSEQRFDMLAPWRLEQATRDGDVSLLVTQGPQPGSSGFEWRDADIDVQTGARLPRAAAIPASGWAQPFDRASLTLHLPPAHRLLGATGVDSASPSWIGRWSLLDLFLASLVLLMAWRMKQPAVVAALLGWAAWSWHEPSAPRLTLLVAIGLVLLLRHVPAGRWQTSLAWLQRGVLALAVLWSLLFAATQLKWAIFPQLEEATPAYPADGFADNAGEMAEMTMEAPLPQAAPASRAKSVANETLDRIEVTGSRIKRMDLFQYPTDAIPQAGRARPDWQWHTHQLGWNGPVLASDTMRLWISPPWLTRTLRVLSVLLLGYALLAIARRSWPPLAPAVPAAPREPLPGAMAATAMVVLAFALSPPAHAQATPDGATLDALRERLLEPEAACHPDCATLATVEVRRAGAHVVLALQAHAQERMAWPLPWPSEAPALVGLRVDGVAAEVLRRDAAAFVVLERGVHRVEAEFASAEGRWRLEFPLLPARVAIADETLESSGIDEGQLIGNTLELIAAATGGEAGTDAAPEAGTEAIPPFVRVRRHVTIDQQWRLHTQVERIAPARGGLTVPVRLLPGELPLENAPPFRDGVATVSIPAGEDSVAWTSRLTPAPTYALAAADAANHAEEWLVDAAPLLHVEAAGLPESESQNSGVRRYLPLPGETLTLTVTRPAAVEGATLAIENVTLSVRPGQRARDATLELTLRSTRAGQHWLALPEDSELLGFAIDGVDQPRVLDAGRVAIPLRAQAQRVTLSWREAIAAGVAMRTPGLALGADAGNLRIALSLPEDRWLLAASGPGVGPALLYWPQLALLVLVAWGLARLELTPLRFHHWLLLGLGFSTVAWLPAAVVAAWLLLLGWRARRDLRPTRTFSLGQLGLLAMTAVALVCLIAAVPYGLLGRPDMQIAGNGSWAQSLNWYLDGSDGALPSAAAWSLPLWAYKIAILAWAIWLANALIGWLRWGWTAWSRGGRWHWPARRAAMSPPPPAAS